MTVQDPRRRRAVQGRRSAHWQQRRDEILRRGAELFAARGFDRTTVQDLMDEFHSTAAAFYYYYSDKNELLAEMLDRFIARAENRLLTIDDQPIPHSEKLRLMIVEHTAAVAGDPTMAAVLFDELETLPEPVRARTRARITAYTDRLEEIYAGGAAEDEFIAMEPHVAVPLVLGMCNQTYRWFRPSDSLSAAELGEIAAEMAMRALVARVGAANE